MNNIKKLKVIAGSLLIALIIFNVITTPGKIAYINGEIAEDTLLMLLAIAAFKMFGYGGVKNDECKKI